MSSLTASLESSYPCTSASTYTAKLQLVREYLQKPEAQIEDDLAEISFELGNDVSAVDSVPTALFCALRGIQARTV